MKLEFLDASDSVIDTHTLDLVAAGQVSDDNSGANENGGNVEFDDWRQFSWMPLLPLERKTCEYPWVRPVCSLTTWMISRRRFSTKCL